MKTLLLTLLILLGGATVAGAAPSVSFTWLLAPNAAWGTKVYIGTETGVYNNTEDAGINTFNYTLENALEYNTTYYFTATHYDPTEGLESAKANEIVWTSPGPDAILFNPFDKKEEHPIKSYILRFLFKE